MAITVLITLTTAGADTGPFDLYSNTDGYVTAFETGVAKAALVGGYVSVLVPDSTTTIRVQSTAACTNYVDIPVTEITTTTSTTTAFVLYELQVSARDIGASLSVEMFYSVNGGFPTSLGIVDAHGCFDLSLISGLSLGDIVTFTTSTSCVMTGAVGYNVCPLISGSSTTYNFIISTPGTDYVSVSINSNIIP